MAAKDEGPREDLERKPSKVALLRSGLQYKLLDDVFKTFLLSDPETIPAIRDHEDKAVFEVGVEGAASAEAVDANWIFLMHYFSTFAGDGVPNSSLFEDIFYLVCRTYAIFPAQTRKKVQKEWAKQQAGHARSLCVHCYGLFTRAGKARTPHIQMLKDLIRKVAKDKHGGNYELAIQENSNAKPGDDEVEIGSSSGQDTHDQEREVIAVDDEGVSEKEVTITKEADQKNPDNQETVPMEDTLDEELRAWYLTQDSHPPDWVLQKAPQLEQVHEDDESTRRQAMKDRKPLLPGVPKLGEGLEAQVASMMPGEAGDVDALQAQAKVRQAARDATRGLTDEGKEPKHTARKGKGRGRGRGRGKGAGKGKTEHDSTAADTTNDKKRKDAECNSAAPISAMKKPKPDDAEQEAVDPPQDSQAAPSTAAQPEKQQVEKADVGEAEGEEATEAPAPDGKPKRTRATRPKLTGEGLQAAWTVQEEELKKGGVPIPEGFKGAQKSYTLPPRDPASMSQIGVLWCNKNLYVKWAKNPATGVNVDSYGGCTVSVLKRGGWKNSFELATFIAGWVDALPANSGK